MLLSRETRTESHDSSNSGSSSLITIIDQGTTMSQSSNSNNNYSSSMSSLKRHSSSQIYPSGSSNSISSTTTTGQINNTNRHVMMQRSETLNTNNGNNSCQHHHNQNYHHHHHHNHHQYSLHHCHSPESNRIDSNHSLQLMFTNKHHSTSSTPIPSPSGSFKINSNSKIRNKLNSPIIVPNNVIEVEDSGDGGGGGTALSNSTNCISHNVSISEELDFVPTPPPPPCSSKLPPTIESKLSSFELNNNDNNHRRRSSTISSTSSTKKKSNKIFKFPKICKNPNTSIDPNDSSSTTIKVNKQYHQTIVSNETVGVSVKTSKPITSTKVSTPPSSNTYHGPPTTLPSAGGLKSKKLKPLIHPLDRSIVGIFTLTIFFTILAIMTGAPIVLALFTLVPIVYILKKIFLCHLSSIPDHEPLSSIDTFWIGSEQVTNCILYVDKGLSLEQLRDVISSRLLTKSELSRLRSRLVYKGLCRTPHWKLDHNFDQNYGTMSQPLPMDRPLWQIRYCPVHYARNQVILIIRVHQALSQSGLVSILTHYLSDSAPTTTSTSMITNTKPRFGGVTLSINIFRAIIVGPLTFFLWILWAFTRRRNNYLTKSKDSCSVHWMTIDLPRVYRIKQVTRSTLNDVLLSTIAGSIRAYLTTKTTITNPPDLTASIPIDIKPSSPMECSLLGVNYVLTTSPIPTNTEGAIPRLWEVRHLMEELKTSADTAVMYGAHYLFDRLLPRPLYRFMVNLVNRNSSIYVSNIQGPEMNLSIGSHRLMKAYYLLTPPSYCSIGFNIFTFHDKLYIAISSRSKLINDARALGRLLRSQIDLLHVLLARRRVPGESKRAKRAMYLGTAAADQLQAAHIGLYQSMAGVVVSRPMTIHSQTLDMEQPSPSSQQQQQQTSPQIGNTPTRSVDLSAKLHSIQDELNQLSEAYDMGDPDVAARYEELKQEFTRVLYEMRRRKSIADYGQNIMINIENEDDDDDDNDGELRPPPRRFSVVSIGRRGSIVSSLPSSSRVTPPILSRRSMAATSPEPPSSPEVAFKIETEC
ncbi:hypothetical protein BLOT_015366 [Blomia tropicalis]|nr:hypothetical protein BLOT_015366 [Blomia tropicalis]